MRSRCAIWEIILPQCVHWFIFPPPSIHYTQRSPYNVFWTSLQLWHTKKRQLSSWVLCPSVLPDSIIFWLIVLCSNNNDTDNSFITNEVAAWITLGEQLPLHSCPHNLKIRGFSYWHPCIHDSLPVCDKPSSTNNIKIIQRHKKQHTLFSRILCEF